MAILLTEAAKPSSDVPRNPPPTRPSRQRPAATTIKAPTHTEATARLPKASQSTLFAPFSFNSRKKSLDYHTGANIQTRSAAHLFRVPLDQGDDEVRHLPGAHGFVPLRRDVRAAVAVGQGASDRRLHGGGLGLQP